MKRQLETSDQIWRGLLQIARSRAKFFTKHGERFDRRLYAEIESLIRIALMLRQLAVIDSNPELFKELSAIQAELLRVGQDEYLDFP